MNGERVGVWSQPRAGSPSFQYDAGWVASPAARVLSLSLPFTPEQRTPHRGETVTYFFDNLLPDSDGIRARLQSRFATDSTGAFDLLTAIGRDCVGAVQLLPEGAPSQGYDRIEAEPLDDAGVEQAIGAALSGGRVLGPRQMRRSSVSPSPAPRRRPRLLFHRNRWWPPKGLHPHHAHSEAAARAGRQPAGGHAGLRRERMALLPPDAGLRP
jgi:serine/threonine-protein kinase HipA